MRMRRRSPPPSLRQLSDRDDAGEAVPAGGMADALERGQRSRPVRVPLAERVQAGVQRLVPFSGSRRREMRGADGAGALQARLEPAPQAARLRLAAELAQRDQHAAEVVVAGGRTPRAEADQRLRLVLERVADEPALDGLELGLRMAAERVARIQDQAAKPP